MEPGKSFGDTIPIIWHGKQNLLSTTLPFLNFSLCFRLCLMIKISVHFWFVKEGLVVVVVADLKIISKQMNSLHGIGQAAAG